MRIAIIGCGVGGLTLAKMLLHEYSQADIRLYEAWDDWKTRGGSLNLAQGGKILRYLGLEPALTAASNRPARGTTILERKTGGKHGLGRAE